MHIAICIWGLLRSLRFTIHSYHIFILKALIHRGHTYDTFLHTYSLSKNYTNIRNHEKSIVLDFSEWKLLHPNYVYVENQDEFDASINYPLYRKKGDPWNNDYYSFSNHIRALNSLHHVTLVVESVSKYRNYDAILFLRPDVQFLHPLPVSLLELSSIHKSKSFWFIPDFHRSCDGSELNDRMAMGSLSAGLEHGKKLQTAFLYSQHHILHAEKFSYDHLYQRLLYRYNIYHNDDIMRNFIKSGTSLLRGQSTNSQYDSFNIFDTDPKAISSTTINTNHSAITTSSSASLLIYEIPFRFRRIRVDGNPNPRDLREVHKPSIDGIDSYEDGNRFHYTHLVYRLYVYLRWMHEYIKYFTRPINQYCSPHPRIYYNQIIEYEKKLYNNNDNRNNNYTNYNHNNSDIYDDILLQYPNITKHHHISCNYTTKVLGQVNRNGITSSSTVIVPDHCEFFPNRQIQKEEISPTDKHSGHVATR
jgi:hypothetical protein